MAKSVNKYKNPNQLDRKLANKWRNHYLQYLTALTYQLFEWENLPESIDPRYLEMSLHSFGYVGFYKDSKLGYVAMQGSPAGRIDHYLNNTHFHGVSPVYNKTFPIYSYLDGDKEGRGVVIWNNDFHFPTLTSLELFAQDLADLKEVSSVNLNAQRTPILMTANDKNRFSIEQIYAKYAGGAPVIIGDDMIGQDSINVLKTDAPYILDKLTTQRNAVWNEIMTYLGIKNANLEKKERMITDEVESNNEQINSSSNIYLKSREEACKRINALYGLNISVKLRSDIIDEIESNVSRETKGGEKSSQPTQPH